MNAGHCFCGNALPWVSLAPHQEGWGNTTEIYCTKACAVQDSLRALTARQLVNAEEDGHSWSNERAGGLGLGNFTHYRRVKKALFLTKQQDPEPTSPPLPSYFSSKAIEGFSSPSSSPVTSPLSAYSSDGNNKAHRIVDASYERKGRREKSNEYTKHPTNRWQLSRQEVTFRKRQLFRRGQTSEKHTWHQANISEFDPNCSSSDLNSQHNRNSSLSSTTNSARFTSHSTSTRVTSTSSLTEFVPLKVSLTLPQCILDYAQQRREEQEDLFAIPRVSEVPVPSPNSNSPPIPSGLLPIQAVLKGDESDEAGSAYDPFELDQLLSQAPNVSKNQVQGPLEAGEYAEDITSNPQSLLLSVEPLNIVQRRPNAQPLPKTRPTLSAGQAADEVRLVCDKPYMANGQIPANNNRLLLPGVFNRHLFPPSPSCIPTTPSVSPSLLTPIPGGVSGTSTPCVTSSTPSRKGQKNSPQPTFSLHRSRNEWDIQIPMEQYQYPASEPDRRRGRFSPPALDALLRDESSAGFSIRNITSTCVSDALVHPKSARPRPIVGLLAMPDENTLSRVNDLTSYQIIGPGKPLYLEPIKVDEWLPEAGGSANRPISRNDLHIGISMSMARNHFKPQNNAQPSAQTLERTRSIKPTARRVYRRYPSPIGSPIPPHKTENLSEWLPQEDDVLGYYFGCQDGDVL